MLRWMVPALAAMLTVSSALAADLPATPKRRAAVPPQDPPKVYVGNLPGTPLLPGSHTLPGYYGRPWSYDYQGAYYGGTQVDYFWRLPYACGVYGYC
ncbi:hypothetical protein [Bradyrhizobium sp. CCH5-F6]|uniref:hypothetical protein n=1 Tax=Bradyrhizobium sp. CCH5-F6 TaxID=1768753 RepID=UPI00076A4C95|nr:hypothetical protein [Bradyrhizobium sp. CCH5-F6]